MEVKFVAPNCMFEEKGRMKIVHTIEIQPAAQETITQSGSALGTSTVISGSKGSRLSLLLYLYFTQ